jgi:tryptophan 7-halogenase
MEYRSTDNLVVVGGGTAGWLTALTAKKKFPNSEVTLIESEEIGILGAGEGSTPNLLNLLEHLDIPLNVLISKTNSTLKNGIRFVNWKNDSNYFYHNFFVRVNDLDENNYIYKNEQYFFNYYYFLSIFQNTPNQHLTTVDLLNEDFKSPFIYSSSSTLFPVSLHSVHFDASKLATLLKEIALERGIKRIEGKVVDIVTDNNNDISSLILESNESVQVDFVFDCSGFFRLIIGKHYNSPWKSHSKKLTVKAALPFFIPVDSLDDLPPYTEAIAMDYGWIWQIPLQNRFGCGYVYDSDFISEDEARIELEEYLGFEPEYPRKDKGSFKFEAGYYEKPWINNCISFGLSSGFIEPLEATSIGVTVIGLQYVFSDALNLKTISSIGSEKYNKYMCQINEEISDLIYLHYMTGRTDTDFWKQFTVDNAPERIKEVVELWSTFVPRIIADSNSKVFFSLNGWFSICLGLGIIDREVIKKFVIENNLSDLIEGHNRVKTEQKRIIKKALSHKEAIIELKKSYENK